MRCFLVVLFLISTWGGEARSAPLDDAIAAYEAGNYEDAVDLLRPLAQQGNAAAQNQLASMYATGQGVERDDAEAVKWLRMSAEQGYASAQFNLGVFYTNGQSVARSYAEAARWFQRAAEQGIADAQFNLGALYEDGQGVTQDFAEAAKWYRKASRQGVAAAQRSLGALYEGGRGGIKQDYAEAAKWYRLAAGQGDPEAQNKLAYLYTFGQGVGQDHSEAARWYRKAAEQGVAEAQFNLGLMHEDGLGVAVDYVSACKWYTLAAAQGDEKASKNLESLRSLMAREQIDEAQRLAAAFSAASQPAPQPAAVKEEGFFQQLIGKAQKALQGWRAPPPAVAPSTAAARSDVDKPRYARSAENPADFALVIGIEKYSSIPEARFAERDSRAVKAHLLAMGYPERNIKYLAGQDATKSKIGAYLESWLPRVTAPDSRVFFYFSGHGAPDAAGKAYLVPWDGDPNFLSDTAYPLKRLHAKLNALKAKEIIVVLDSCFSGLGGRSVLPRGTRPFFQNIKDVFGSGKSTTLTASADDQISGTAEEQGHGLFTYYFLKGLNGAAADERGRVTLRALHEYLAPKVADAANRENRTQTPQLKAPPGGGKAEFVLRDK